MGVVALKRIYDEASPADGVRVLVDRLWPRGVSKEDAKLDVWLKEIAPTPELRRWWNHDAERMDEFTVRYRTELDDNPAVDELRALVAANATVTLLYGAHDPSVNHARVLRDYLGDA